MALVDTWEVPGSVHSLAISRDGTRLAAGVEKDVWLWDKGTGQVIHRGLKGHGDEVCSLAFSPDGRTLASSSTKHIIIWNVQDGTTALDQFKAYGGLDSVAFSLDGRILASSSFNNTIRLWDAHTGQKAGVSIQAGDQVCSMAISADGRIIAGVSRRVIAYDMATGTMLFEYDNPLASSCRSLALSPDGRFVACGLDLGQVQILDAITGNPTRELLTSHWEWIRGIAFSPDGRYIASGSADAAIRIWDAETGTLQIGPLSGRSSTVFSVTFTPDGNQLVSGGVKKINIWNTEGLNRQQGNRMAHTFATATPEPQVGVVSSDRSDKPAEVDCIPEDGRGNKFFETGDGDFRFRVSGTILHTHKYLLKRFARLKCLIQQDTNDQANEELLLDGDPTDFLNTFKIIYASPIEGLPDLDSATLVSALRIASVYDYPGLQTFVKQKLEDAQLSAVDRICIAREFKFTAWEAPAYEELCARDEPITEDEANQLGISAFVRIAKSREMAKQRRYQDEIGRTEPRRNATQQRDSSELNTVTSPLDTAASTKEFAAKHKGGAQSCTGTPSDSFPPKPGNEIEVEESNNQVTQKPKYTFIGISSQKRPDESSDTVSVSGSFQYKMPGCQCWRTAGSDLQGEMQQDVALDRNPGCTISPCAAGALAELQATQIAHVAIIARLESTIQNIKSSILNPGSV